LSRLNNEAALPYIAELIECKKAGPEACRLAEADLSFHEKEYERLCRELELASQASPLPEVPSGVAALNDLLVRIRLQGLGHLEQSV
jgi:hypothetical protein